MIMKVYTEDDLIMISALQHFVFCPRQCALIHIEQAWAENRLTAEGRIMHERVHEGTDESRGDIRITRGLPLRSLRLGIVGVADVVEFHRLARAPEPGVQQTGKGDCWLPFPIEYKRGKPKPDHCDAVQLCAQAISLEEMLGVEVPAGALFYGATRRRLDVSFTGELRMEVEEAAAGAHRLLESGQTPKAVYSKRCENCSLLADCLPKAVARGKSINRYLAGVTRIE